MTDDTISAESLVWPDAPSLKASLGVLLHRSIEG